MSEPLSFIGTWNALQALLVVTRNAEPITTRIQRERLLTAAISLNELALQTFKTAHGAYDELIMAVETKHEGESRHQTARRYIQEREHRPSSGLSQEAR